MEKITFLNFKKSALLLLLLFLGLPIYSTIVPAISPMMRMADSFLMSGNTDSDGDGVPDSVDIDSDNDGILDVVEDANLDGDNNPATNPTDSDGDGIPNYLDLDSDGDGLLDNYEAQNFADFQLPSGVDSDGNGLDDIYEDSPGAGNGLTPIDTDSDDVPDYLDMDSDNDGILDQNESSVVSTDFDCSTVPKLDFGMEPTLESGDALSEGAVYRYQNVTEDLDALVTIEKVVNGEILYFDQNETDAEFFKPEIYFTTTSEERRPYVDFRISFVDQGTDTPVVLEELSANFIDVDGNDEYQEYNRFNTPASYTLDADNEITVQNTTGGFLVNGGTREYDGISNEHPSVNVAVEFINIDSFVFRFGIEADVDDNFKTNVARQAGIQFTCLDNFNDPQTVNFSEDIDSDDDGYPDRLDIDSDDDGIPDNVEAQPTFEYIPPSGDDLNGNGLDDAYESGDTMGLSLEDTDADGTPDYLDDDSDNDWVPDNNEGNDFNFDGIPDWTYTGVDSDGDGLDDGYEGSDVNDGFDVNDEIENPATDLPDRDGTEDVNYRDIDDDGDGIDTPDEDANGDGDPTNDDTDEDGTPDYLDNDTDTDGDGVTDEDEEEDGTDPTDPCDFIEEHITQPQTGDYLTADCDGDGVTNEDEKEDGTDPFDPCDYNPESITLPQTGDYLEADCDGDGVTNGDEKEDGTDPQDPCDFVLDSQTVDPDSTWNSSDCDGDGVTNEDEKEDGTDPLDSCDYDPESVTLPQSADWEALDCDGDGNPNETDPDPLTANANDDFGSTPALTEVAINILENDDYLPNNDPINVGVTNLSRIGGDASGTVTFDDETGFVNYTPVASESNSTVTIIYQVCNILPDPSVCASATIYIEVGANVLDAVDDNYTASVGEDGVIADSNVLSNDTYNGEPVTLADVILTSTPTDQLIINEDGSVGVVPGTEAGTYTINYTICDATDPANCDSATVTVEVMQGAGNVIDAVDDNYTASVGEDGVIADGNVLSNDTYNGETVTFTDVILTSTPTNELTINEDGSVSVAPGTEAGTYTINYTICDVLDVNNCDSATVTVEVMQGTGNVIDAVDDNYTASVGEDGVIADGNILSNDTYNGEAATLTDVILTSTPTDQLIINEDGSVSVAPGTEAGTYTINYTICDVLDVNNCDSATVTVEVMQGGDNVIDAIDDTYNAGAGGGLIANSDVLFNDTLNGEAVSMIDVILTSAPTNGLTVNEDGSVSVAPGTQPGTYTIEYTICETANPNNCDTATVTVVVEAIEVNQMLTPNGDLKNDFLFIRGVEYIKSSSIRIFNRWGTLVFEGNNYDNVNNVFDGRVRGKSALSVNDYLPAGVYFYIFNYETVQGSFTDSEYIYISR
ncbi:MAG: gliding motility-associated C-terminal domain-containing protein [Muricauda sp.]|nr:gliding motility-associated C-terminal domain-containing protein [Allomuricauda sp.]MBA4746585.1 gliding motility-associated C-terminal domain-containing protein [Allomuricauda sp.]